MLNEPPDVGGSLDFRFPASRAGTIAPFHTLPLDDRRWKPRGVPVGIPAGRIRLRPNDEVLADITPSPFAFDLLLRYCHLDPNLSGVEQRGPWTTPQHEVTEREAADELPLAAANQRCGVSPCKRVDGFADDLLESHIPDCIVEERASAKTGLGV